MHHLTNFTLLSVNDILKLRKVIIKYLMYYDFFTR